MQNFFEQNLKMLSEYDPDLADRIRNHNPSGNVEILKTPAHQLSLRFHHEGRTHLLHSSRDPMREAQRWVSETNLTSVYNLMVFGCGLMHHVYQLVYKYQQTLRNLVIIEPNLDIVHAAFSSVDLSPFLRTKTTFFWIPPHPSEIRSFMNRFLTTFTLDGLDIVEHPASCELNPTFYQEVRTIIDESLQSGEILLRTKVQLGGLIQENIIRNIPLVLNNPTASALGSLLTNTPAIIVGAGPSLDWNMNRLTHVDDKGVIIAADTVFQKLKKNGINPHMVVTSDPTYLNNRHFEGIDGLDETILMFSPSVYHEIPRRLFGTKVSLPLPGSKFMMTLKDALGDPSYMATGTNVGQTCFNLARYMGCDPIILVGMDFSFPPEGGTTHASETALQRRITLSNNPGKMIVELIGEKQETEEFDPIMVDGNLGGQVATNKFWFAYRRSMEEEIKRTGARVINSTEGGAKIEGAEIRKLSDSLQEFCQRDAMVSSTLQMSVGFFFGAYIEEGVSVLNESLSILNLGKEKAEDGLQLVNDLKICSENPTPDVHAIQELLDRINITHRELVQDQKVYVVLDEAADCVLTPFLKQETRSLEHETIIQKAHKTIKRYQPYFSGMKELCEQYARIIQETLDSMDTISFSF